MSMLDAIASYDDTVRLKSIGRRSDTIRTSLVTTVLNAATEVDTLLTSLLKQTRLPDEIIVVDGGSTDATADVVRGHAKRDSRIRLMIRHGANIGQGRNAGIAAATGEIILSTDSGCRLEATWVERIVAPFEREADVELVAGAYRIAASTLTESVVGTATMRGELDPIDPDTFNPSCRSLAMRKSLWERAGRFPEWIEIDDTLFNIKLRRMDVVRRFAADAIVHWRPRSTIRGIYRQFRFYASWRGHTQLDSASNRYHLRNVATLTLLGAVGFLSSWVWILLAVLSTHWYVVGFHRISRRVSKKLNDWRAYPMCMLVHWAIVLGGLTGYVRATWQRLRDPQRYRQTTEAYLAAV